MTIAIKEPKELKRIYENRFHPAQAEYRKRLWSVLVHDYFQRWIAKDGTVLDLGCGYGEFINTVECKRKIAMDLNPDTKYFLAPEVELLAQDCAARWQLPDACIDTVFTSNFFEHLPDKLALRSTILEVARCLRPGGQIIALGPNIRIVDGKYWDFWDHFLCLTDLSLAEALYNNGFQIVQRTARFLPYTTINKPRVPLALVRIYLRIPFVWRLLGEQFLVIAKKQ